MRNPTAEQTGGLIFEHYNAAAGTSRMSLVIKCLPKPWLYSAAVHTLFHYLLTYD